MNSIDYGLIFTAAILSGGHCLGMCGGLLAASLLAEGQTGRLRAHLLYHLGRMGLYVGIGALAGWAGGLALVTTPLLDLATLVQWLAGGMMIMLGLSMLNWLPFSLGSTTLGESALGRLAGQLLRRAGPWRALVLGILTGLLPCPLHWAFQAKAFASGSLWGGVVVMGLFGLGTALPLSAFGLLTTWLGTRWRNRFYQTAALLIIALGVLTLLKNPNQHQHHTPALEPTRNLPHQHPAQEPMPHQHPAPTHESPR